MNSFCLYNIRNISLFCLTAGLVFFALSFTPYALSGYIFYVIAFFVFLYIVYSSHKILKKYKKIDDYLVNNNIIRNIDPHSHDHFINHMDELFKIISNLMDIKEARQQEHKSMEEILSIMSLWNKGQLEERINLDIAGNNKLIKSFITSLNDFTDMVDAYMRESLGAMDALSRHQYYRVILKKGLVGSFLLVSTKINENLTVFGKKHTELTQKLSLDIKEMITTIVDDTSNITKSCNETVNSCKTTLQKSEDATIEAKTTYKNLSSIEHLALDLKKAGSNMQNIVVNANALSKEGTKEIERTKIIVSDLKNRSATIHGIVEIIREIAQKTNLLSINAAIEAAKAGKEGHGFRIVADEVRSLAQATMTSAKDIEQQIDLIQNSIGQTVNSVSFFTNIITNISTVSSDISTKMDEQNSSLDQINENIRSFCTSIQNLINNIENVQKDSYSAQSSSQNIFNVFEKLNNNICGLERSIAKSLLMISGK